MDERHEELIAGYLKYLEWIRLPEGFSPDPQNIADVLAHHEQLAATNPYSDAWDDFHLELGRHPKTGWTMLLAAIERCHASDLSNIGSGELEVFFFRNAIEFGDRIEHEIRTNARFLDAFKYAEMGGVPAHIWQRFNRVLAEMGVPEEQLSEWSWVDEDLYPPPN